MDRNLTGMMVTFLSFQSAFGQETAGLLPAGPGLSKQYPEDAGIDENVDVLFVENFENGTVKDFGKRWDEIRNKNGKVFSLSDDIPSSSSGKRSLKITATLGKNSGGHLYKQLPRGVDRVFARFYVKFYEEAEYIHHFVHLGGQRPALRWPRSQAGTKPKGDDWFSVGIEPVGRYGRHTAPGVWNFYTYWQEMKISADRKYWGNGLHPVNPQQVPRNRWQCIEAMIKLNTVPDKSDGELALWLDGKPVAHFLKDARRGHWSGMGFDLVKQGGVPFEGFRFRTHDRLEDQLLLVTTLCDRSPPASKPR